MAEEARVPGTGLALLAGLAYGAGASFLGAWVLDGAWPEGGTALLWALVLTLLGGAVMVLRRARLRARAARTAAAPADVAAPADAAAPASGVCLAKTGTASSPDSPTDASPGSSPDSLSAEDFPPPGRSSLGIAAAIWALALLGGGIWHTVDSIDRDTPLVPEARPSAPTAPAAPAPPTGAPVSVAWTVPAVGRKYDQGVGAWPLGDAVAQGRLDGLFAYDAADGHIRWSVPAPAREGLCAMTPAVGEGVGLVAHGRHEKPCATVLAVRAADGKVLWRKSLGGKGLLHGALAVGGDTALTAEDGAVRARSATTGEPRWERATPPGCEPRALGADAARTLLVEQCGDGARLLALDTRTGTRRWTRDLPVESGAAAAVVSVAPAVVAVDETDDRGTHAFLSFDDRGAPVGVPLPLAGPEGVLSAPGGVGGGDATRPVVRDGLLLTLRERELVPDAVVAYRLADGRKAWEYTSGFRTADLTPEPDGRVAVLVGGGPGPGSVVLLDPATGRPVAERSPGETKGAAVSIDAELLPVTGGHVVLNHLVMTAEPAAFGLR